MVDLERAGLFCTTCVNFHAEKVLVGTSLTLKEANWGNVRALNESCINAFRIQYLMHHVADRPTDTKGVATQKLISTLFHS